jgi:hypothetical protein
MKNNHVPHVNNCENVRLSKVIKDSERARQLAQVVVANLRENLIVIKPKNRTPERIEKETAEGRAFYRKRVDAIGPDVFHLTGAIYCDIFTCDQLIDECLGQSRTLLGKPKQISQRNKSENEFISEIENKV